MSLSINTNIIHEEICITKLFFGLGGNAEGIHSSGMVKP